MSYQSLLVCSSQFRTVLACIFLLFTSINSTFESDDCFTAFLTPPVNSSNFSSSLIKFGRVHQIKAICMSCGNGKYSQTRK